jgi:hypothetical protein
MKGEKYVPKKKAGGGDKVVKKKLQVHCRWAAGLLGCWAAGLLGCWAAGPLGCWLLFSGSLAAASGSWLAASGAYVASPADAPCWLESQAPCCHDAS